MRKQGIGLRAEERIASFLKGKPYFRSVIQCAYNNPYDLVVDGHRVEVKCAAARPDSDRPDSLIWTFNLHRHGILSEQTDLYLLRLEKVPYSKAAIHMLLKAPVGVTTLYISMRSLLNQEWAAAVADFYTFAKGTYGRKEVAA
jgi:hypothetical protein